MKYAALVIALNEYDKNPHLINALNDGKAMAEKFKELKYDVIELLGDKATYNGYVDALNDLMGMDAINAYNAVVLYFSGHGFMTNAADFLALKDCDKLEYNGGTTAMMKSVRVLDFIKTFHNRGVNAIIVIIDACRDDISNYADEKGGEIEKTRGIAETLTSDLGTKTQPPFQSFIAYSTSATQKAYDGTQSVGHSRYTAALLEEIEKPIPIEAVFRNVRKKVHVKEKDQLPWEFSCLTEEFCFNYGQLDPYYGSLYPKECYEDKNYVSYAPIVTDVHKNLKASHESDRLSGLFKLMLHGRGISNEDMFVTGRLIMRQAISGSEECRKFIQSRRLERFKRGSENDLVNGLLYELYFDSENKYHQKRIENLTLLNSLSQFSRHNYCESSVRFINKSLEEIEDKPTYRIGDSLFYSVQVLLKRSDYQMSNGTDIYEIKSVMFEQSDIKDELKLESYLLEPLDVRNEISRALQIPPILLRIRINPNAKNIIYRPIPDRFDEMVFYALTKEPVDEIDQLGTRGYSVEDCSVVSIDDIQVEADYIMAEGKCDASFNISNDDEHYSMSFPGSFSLELKYEEGKWRNIKRNAFSFDTTKYYE